MGEGGIIRVKSYQRPKKVKLVQVELEDTDGVPVFPRILVEDLNTSSQFWAHLGENDERNHTSVSFSKLIKAGNPITIEAMFSLRKFWLSYGNPENEVSKTVVNQAFAHWRPAVLRIWKSPLTKSEAALGPAKDTAGYGRWKEAMRKKRVFWTVPDSQSGGEGSSECCYWS